MTEKEKIELLKPIMGSAKMATRAVEFLAGKVYVPSVEEISQEMRVPLRTAAKVRSSALLSGSYMMSAKSMRISSPAVAAAMVPELRFMLKEHLFVITMTGSYEVIGKHDISVGSTNRTIVDPKDVYSVALADRASKVIVFHNHPGNSLEPSPEDLKFTNRLANAGRVLGITLSDSIIVARSGFLSIYTTHPEAFEKSKELPKGEC